MSDCHSHEVNCTTQCSDIGQNPDPDEGCFGFSTFGPNTYKITFHNSRTKDVTDMEYELGLNIKKSKMVTPKRADSILESLFQSDLEPNAQ